MKKLIKKNDLVSIRSQADSANRKIVFTYGTFDLIHSGHAAYLLDASNHGDILVVGVSSDKCKQELRGKGFPLIHQKNRMEMLTYFNFVDYVLIVDDRKLTSVLKTLKPDIYYTLSLDWKSHLRKPEEEKIVAKNGGKIVQAKPSKPFISSSDIVELVADLKIKEIIEYFFGKIRIDLSKGDWSQKKHSGLKTDIREESLHFGNHIDKLGLWGMKIRDKLLNQSSLAKVSNSLKKKGQKIVLSSGSCDLVHSGHARFYAKARDCGDVLILAIPADHVIRKQKGRGRPIVSDKSRAELMAFFEFVDYVYVFDTDDVIPIIELIEPDVFFTVNEGWNEIDKSPIAQLMQKWKGKIVTVPPQAEGLSSSKLIRKAAGLRVRKIFKEVLSEAEKWNSLKD